MQCPFKGLHIVKKRFMHNPTAFFGERWFFYHFFLVAQTVQNLININISDTIFEQLVGRFLLTISLAKTGVKSRFKAGQQRPIHLTLSTRRKVTQDNVHSREKSGHKTLSTGTVDSGQWTGTVATSQVLLQSYFVVLRLLLLPLIQAFHSISSANIKPTSYKSHR